MKTIRYVFSLIFISIAVLNASQGQGIVISDFTHNPIPVNLKVGDSGKKLIDTLNAYTLFASDIIYERVENSKSHKIDSTTTVDSSWFDRTNTEYVKASRYWNIKPRGTLLKDAKPFTILIDHNEFIKDLNTNIALRIAEQQIIPEKEYYTIQITNNGTMLRNQDRMPSYRKDFNANDYVVTLNKVDPQPHLEYTSARSNENDIKAEFILENTPSNLELYNNQKNKIDIKTIKISVLIGKNIFQIRVFSEQKMLGNKFGFIDSPSKYKFYTDLTVTHRSMNTKQDAKYDSDDNFNENLCQLFYHISKQLLSAWAQSMNYSLTEDGLPIPIELSTDRTITIEGSGNQIQYNSTLDINALQPLKNVIDMYKEFTGLAKDINVTLYDQSGIFQGNSIADFTDEQKWKYNARLSRTWPIAPQGSIIGHQIKPFNINLEEKESIESVKRKIIDFLNNTYEITEARLPNITITKKGNMLNDNDTMPLYVEPFNPNEYTVKIDTPSKYDPIILENKQGLAHRVKAQQPTPIGKPAPEKPKSLLQRLASWFSWSQKGKN